MKNNKKGFTLAELLIVIAIMAILIAIAIPVFSAQLEKARHAVDMSTLRSAESLAEAHFLLYHANVEGGSGDVTLTFGQDANKNLGITECSVCTGDSYKLAGATPITKANCTKCSGPLKLIVNDDGVKLESTCKWSLADIS